MSNGYYKKYARGMREQYVEGNFTDGQVFTRSPLETGKSRLIVNYDLLSSGEALTPRKGYRTSSIGLALNSTGLEPKLTSNLSITQSRDALEEDNKHYRLMVANSFSDTDKAYEDYNLKSAPAELWVMDSSDVSKYSIFDEYDIATKDMYAIPLSYEIPDAETYDSTKSYAVKDFCTYESVIYRCTSATTGTFDSTKWKAYTYPESYYTVPSNPIVHGTSIEHPEMLARPIGTFAWGDDYYGFNTDGELIRTKYVTADADEGTSATYIAERMDPMEITATEATTGGFNMLADDPYTFTDAFKTGVITLDGIMIYDSKGKIVTEPVQNTKYTIRLFYEVQSGVKYKYVWQYRDKDSDTWNDLDTQEVTSTQSSTVTVPTEIKITDFSSPIENAIIRIQAYKYSSSAYETTPEAFMSIGVEFSKTASTTTANRDLINYDLSKATGITYWKNMLWVYGLAQDPTVLFASDVNQPTYFPYPNNADIFDEPIISCVPFNDTMLVFTRSQLIQLTLSSDGGWTKKTLQSNLSFTDFDGRFVQVVKNMVFFKSGNYYYMIVPKTLSLQNELALAPVSKNIDYFLDEFSDNIPTLLEVLYQYDGTATLVNHYNYLNYEDIHNVYTYKTDSGLYLNVVLLYNTVDRTWRMYTYESQETYMPLKQDATKLCTLITPAYVLYNDSVMPGVQLIDNDPLKVADFYIPKNTVITKTDSEWDIDDGKAEAAFNALHTFKNYTLLDTGYRDNQSDYNKRFRELQIKFTNTDSTYLKFITEFIIDGETRIGRYKYTTEHITDPTSSDYGLIYISKTPVENLEVPGASLLGEDETDVNAWTLDVSRFPEVAFWKARLKVSGKGYTPRFRLICRTEERYELLGYIWVYRMMYSR